jgi:hypothetical protein
MLVSRQVHLREKLAMNKTWWSISDDPLLDFSTVNGLYPMLQDLDDVLPTAGRFTFGMGHGIHQVYFSFEAAILRNCHYLSIITEITHVGTFNST